MKIGLYDHVCETSVPTTKGTGLRMVTCPTRSRKRQQKKQLLLNISRMQRSLLRLSITSLSTSILTGSTGNQSMSTLTVRSLRRTLRLDHSSGHQNVCRPDLLICFAQIPMSRHLSRTRAHVASSLCRGLPPTQPSDQKRRKQMVLHIQPPRTDLK